jgi:hypothetical protein
MPTKDNESLVGWGERVVDLQYEHNFAKVLRKSIGKAVYTTRSGGARSGQQFANRLTSSALTDKLRRIFFV